MKLKVEHWSVVRKCQRGVVMIQDGLSCDRWGAQRRLSCTMTVSYNADTTQICVLCGQAAAVRLHINVPFPK